MVVVLVAAVAVVVHPGVGVLPVAEAAVVAVALEEASVLEPRLWLFPTIVSRVFTS